MTEVSGKLRMAVDYIADAALSYGIAWRFYKKASFLFGYNHWRTAFAGDDTFTLQLDLDFP